MARHRFASHTRLILVATVIISAQSFLIATQSAQSQQRQSKQTPQLALQLKATLSGHTKSIDRIAFSPDGELIATSSEDGTMRLWDAHTGELKSIVSGADRFKLDEQEWFLKKQYRALHDFPKDLTGELKDALTNGAEKLAISPGRDKLLTSSTENPEGILGRRDILRLWDITTGRLQMSFAAIPHGITDVYWSPDGSTMIVVGSARTRTRLLNASTGRVTAKLPYGSCDLGAWIGDDGCQPFNFAADGSVFLKEKEPIKLWSSNTGELLAELKTARPPAVFSPTAKHLLVTRGEDKRTALLWDVVIK